MEIDKKENNNEEANAEEFIKKICALYKEDAKEYDYISGIKSLRSDLENSESLKLYLQKLIEITEKLIKEDREVGESFLNTYFLHVLKCIGAGFQRCVYKVENEELYQDICSRIISFINVLKEKNINVDKIYDVYAMEFIKKMDMCRNIKNRNAASINRQTAELICEIDKAEERLYNKGGGLWYSGHILDVRNIISKKNQNSSKKMKTLEKDDEDR